MTFQVKASASPEHLDRLARRVEDALRAARPKGPWQPRDLALAALALAHDLDDAAARIVSAERALAAKATDRDADAQRALLLVTAERDAALARAEDEARRRREVEAETRDVLRRVLSRIDLALEDDEVAEGDEPAPLA